MSKLFMVSVVVIAALAAHTTPAFSDYKIDWYSVNSGGGAAAAGDFRLTSSAGQSAAGFVLSTSNLHWIGFWAGDVPTATLVSTADQAKLLPDGTFASIAGKIAISDQDDFNGFFYVEDENRVSGIRVATPAGPVSGLLRGRVVNVIGTLGTTAAGERQFTGPVVLIVGTHDALTPLGMSNLWIGGGSYGEPPEGQYGVTGGFGVNNVGLLVSTWGRVIAEGQGWVLIDDGSGTPVRLDTTTIQEPPEEGQYVTVVGVSSLYKPGSTRLRLVLPRDAADIISR